MDNIAPRWTRCTQWNLWPLTRLLIVLATLGLWAHWRFDWRPPALPQVGEFVLGQIAVFFLCSLVSSILGQLYLLVLTFPLLAAIVLNDWFYEGSRWLLRLISGPRPPRLEAGLALAGELGLFVGLSRSIVLLLKTYCHF